MVNRLRDGGAAHRGAVAASAGPVPVVAAGRPVLTARGAEILAAEVERLRDLKGEEFRARRRDALSVSAADEDAQLAIGEDEAVIDARIANLAQLLHQAEIVDHDVRGEDIVNLGSRVLLEDLTTGAVVEYEMVAWHDGATAGTVSAASPVGQAILGRGVGDELTIGLPGGRQRSLRIAGLDDVASLHA
ncbi:GreA/GreB family elongation factor [Capillimicrobium parvum]|uniref:Transcription elongation factor GreA n=1 Tax=Capillimicrobium parvum TaxID=2884022 RepID=A0A9E6XVE5_9ACTN|nr:GreA/GreB family elongation factor [Capillimicrobium parvum]UGS34492.1 Transcription elongation factor GreA [Capillimicrobium parvum]